MCLWTNQKISLITCPYKNPQNCTKVLKHIPTTYTPMPTEEVIDIERNENVAIEVSATTPEVVEEISIFSKWRRVIIGVILMMLLVLPLIGGIAFSYLMRSSQYQPADPYNIWPDSEYTGTQVVISELAYKDEGFSFTPNNHILIKNGDDSYFTVGDPNNSRAPLMYMSVYMIENLYGRREKYGLHVVTKNSADGLSQFKNQAGLNDENSFRHDMRDHRTINTGLGIYLSNDQSDMVASRTIANQLQNGCNTTTTRASDESDYDYAMRVIATKIRYIAANQGRNLYKLTNSALASYTLPIQNSTHLYIGALTQLQALRNRNREEEDARLERLADEEEEAVHEVRNGFKRIMIQPLKE